jgi:Mor family transcriptional regulator
MQATSTSEHADLELTDLPETYQPVAEAVGIPAALRLSDFCGGSNVYIPKLDFLHQKTRNRRILQEFSGGNYRELAKRYNLSEIRVREIVNQGRACKAAQGERAKR